MGVTPLLFGPDEIAYHRNEAIFPLLRLERRQGPRICSFWGKGIIDMRYLVDIVDVSEKGMRLKAQHPVQLAPDTIHQISLVFLDHDFNLNSILIRCLDPTLSIHSGESLRVVFINLTPEQRMKIDRCIHQHI